jgi:putative Mg2+ transporter-C (MgtC) family protein
VHHVDVDHEPLSEEGQRIAVVTLRLDGRGDLYDLAGELAELPGVRSTSTGRGEPFDE